MILRSSFPGALRASALALSVLSLPGLSGAANVPPLALRPITVGALTTPVSVANAGDGSGRLFVCEQLGKIRVLQGGQLLATPFLDLASKMVTLSSNYDERGLLGLAFHPKYGDPTSPGFGRFYVFYSAPSPNAPGTTTAPVNCRTTISEFKVSANEPNVADPNSERVLLAFDKPQSNHNGGELQFGPDGMLYIAIGDGGGQHDNAAGHTGGAAGLLTISGTLGNAQDQTRLFGKLLRIDPLGTNGPGGAYGIPASNPLVGAGNGVREEIFSYGFRNPWRFSFDDGPGGTQRMYEADVGQDNVEELNLVTLGGNYGWRPKEGTFDHDNTAPNSGLPLIDPIAQYAHVGRTIGTPPLPQIGCSVTGGYVYRGSAIPELKGKYVFADWSPAIGTPGGTLLFIDENTKNADGTWTIQTPQLVGGNPLTTRINAFGRDEAGELYIATRVARGPANDPTNGPTGGIYKLVPALPQTASLSPAKDNTIIEDFTTNSNPLGRVFAGKTNNGFIRRGLLNFNVSGQLPANAIVTDAKVRLNLNTANGASAVNFTLNRLSEDWGENPAGNSGIGQGAAATVGDATWLARFYDPTTPTLWTTAGGNFAATASGSATVATTPGYYTWTGTGLATDVQQWLKQPATEFGWALLGTETASNTARAFDSRESNPGLVPKLDLTYSATPVFPLPDSTFSLEISAPVYTAVALPNGKVFFGGEFGTINGTNYVHAGQLNADGTIDTGYSTEVNTAFASAVVQPDGKIVVGGGFTRAGVPDRNHIARLLPDGTADAGFDPNADNDVAGLALQADGKILVGGSFTAIGGMARNSLARLNIDGSVDTSFVADANDYVFALALQDDGRIIVAGSFTQINGVARQRIARLNADGSVDQSFTVNANASVWSIVVQPNGSIVFGGSFSSVNSTPHPGIVRVDANGVVDAGFTAEFSNGAGPTVSGLTLQADGKILVAGDFTTANGEARAHLARLLPDGSLDTGFTANTDQVAYGTTLQADGRILTYGNFLNVNGVARQRFARLENDFASHSLTLPSPHRLVWQRGGSAPETYAVIFEASTNAGQSWTPLGVGTRIAGGWELRGFTLPAASSQVRARALTPHGGRSSGLVEEILVIPSAPELTTEAATSVTATSAQLHGTVDPNNAATAVSFEYGTANSLLSTIAAQPASISGDGSQSVGATLSGLSPRTTYTVRLKGTNSVGTGQGDIVSFTTPNTPPTAGSGTITVGTGSATIIDILSLTSDADGDSRIIFVYSPQHGKVTVQNGIISYLPDVGFSGTDLLTYTVTDAFGATASSSVSITVNPRSTTPVKELLAAKGQPILGAGVSGSGTEALPTGSTWSSFGLPAINDASMVAFAAVTQTGAKSTTAGIFVGSASAPTLLAAAGKPAPDVTDAVFAAFKDPVLAHDGATAVLATIANAPGKKVVTPATNQGIWTNAFGPLSLLARKGSQAVGAPTGAKWTAFQSVAIADGIAGPLFVAKMAGGGIKPGQDLGLWGTGSDGALRLLLRSGDTASSKTVKSFTVIGPVLYVPGQTRSFNRAGEIVVRATFTDNTTGLVKITVP